MAAEDGGAWAATNSWNSGSAGRLCLVPTPHHPCREMRMNDAQIRERLAKIQALFAGATCDGERDAAEAALRRIQLTMDRTRGPVEPVEYRFSLSNP